MNFVHKVAYISACKQYRYWLSRRWQVQPTSRYVLWVLLNPSTANALIDDATVRKAAGFSDRLGYTQMQFVNLYAHRSTTPTVLKRTPDPVGAENDGWIARTAKKADRIIVAWGQDPITRVPLSRAECVLTLLNQYDLFCFGTNKNSHPCHPLMLPYDTPLSLYQGSQYESGRRAL